MTTTINKINISNTSDWNVLINDIRNSTPIILDKDNRRFTDTDITVKSINIIYNNNDIQRIQFSDLIDSENNNQNNGVAQFDLSKGTDFNIANSGPNRISITQTNSAVPNYSLTQSWIPSQNANRIFITRETFTINLNINTDADFTLWNATDPEEPIEINYKQLIPDNNNQKCSCYHNINISFTFEDSRTVNHPLNILAFSFGGLIKFMLVPGINSFKIEYEDNEFIVTQLSNNQQSFEFSQITVPYSEEDIQILEAVNRLVERIE